MKYTYIKSLSIATIIIMLFSISGCTIISGNHVEDESEKLVAEYAAGLLLKYEKGHEYGLQKLEDDQNLEAEPEIMEEVAEPVQEEEKLADEPELVQVEEQVDPEDVAAAQDVESITEPEYVEVNTGNNIAGVLGLTGIDINYSGCEVCNEYPEDGSGDMYFSLKAQSGKQLLITHYNVSNICGEDTEFNTLYNTTKVRLLINGRDKVVQQMTMLLNDLKSYDQILHANESVDAVLVFEIDQNTSIDSLDLIMINDGEYQVKLQ